MSAGSSTHGGEIANGILVDLGWCWTTRRKERGVRATENGEWLRGTVAFGPYEVGTLVFERA
ncbi:MAG: hypothetical protein ACRDJW_04515 [Thermomicrobiales bacterium]